MENFTTLKPSKVALPLGVLFGFIMILMAVVMYVMDIDPITNPAVGMLINALNYLILPVLLIVIGCNSFKKQNGGYVTFSECLKIGLIICVIAGLLGAVFNVIFTMLFPEYVEQMMSRARDAMIEQDPNLTEGQVEMAMSMAEKFQKWYFVIPVSMVTMAVIGLIYSLIIGAIVKKERPAF